MPEYRSWIDQIPSLDALRVFQAAARQRSFSAAARQLHVTQGAVSHRIRALEDALQTPLFLRTRRRVELTEAGRRLQRAVDEAFASLEIGLSELQAGEAKAPLMVSCSPSFAIRWLVPHLPLLHAAAPELDVRISAADRLEQPGQHNIDVCIRYGPGGAKGVDELRLSVELVTPVCSPQLLVGGPPLATPDDLAHHVLLHDDMLRGHPGRVGWERWLREAGASQVDPTRGVRFSHAHMAVEAALAGQGVALARGILVARDVSEGRLLTPFACAVESGLAYWVLTASAGRVRPQVALFRQWLLDAVRLFPPR